MNLEELLKERKEQLARTDQAKTQLIDELNRCERNIIALQASIATIELIMKEKKDELPALG